MRKGETRIAIGAALAVEGQAAQLQCVAERRQAAARCQAAVVASTPSKGQSKLAKHKLQFSNITCTLLL